MILKVARLGYPVLRTMAQPVAPERINTHEFQRLLDDMVETMHEYVGVGLAAPQVHLPLQVAVLEVEHHPRYPEMPSVPLTYLINPVVTILERANDRRLGGMPQHPRYARAGAAFQEASCEGAGATRRSAGFHRGGFSRPRHPARDRSPEWRGLPRSDAEHADSLSHLAEWHRFALAPPPEDK